MCPSLDNGTNAKKEKSSDAENLTHTEKKPKRKKNVLEIEGSGPPPKKSKTVLENRQNESSSKGDKVKAKDKSKQKKIVDDAGQQNGVKQKKKKKKIQKKDKNDGNKAMAKLHQLKLWKNLEWSCSEEIQEYMKNYTISLNLDGVTYSGTSSTKKEAKYKAAVAALKKLGDKFREKDLKADPDKEPFDVAMVKLEAFGKEIQWLKSEKAKVKSSIYTMTVVLEDQSYTGTASSKTQARHEAAIALLKALKPSLMEDDIPSAGSARLRRKSSNIGKMFKRLEQLQQLNNGEKLHWDYTAKQSNKNLITAAVTVSGKTYDGSGNSETQARQRAAVLALKDLDPTFEKLITEKDGKINPKVRRKSSNIRNMSKKLDQLQQLNDGKKLHWDCTEKKSKKNLITAAVTVAGKTYDGTGNTETQARQSAVVLALKDLNPSYREQKSEKKRQRNDSSKKKKKNANTGNKEQLQKKNQANTPKSQKKIKSLTPKSDDSKTPKQTPDQTPNGTPKTVKRENENTKDPQSQKKKKSLTPKSNDSKTPKQTLNQTPNRTPKTVKSKNENTKGKSSIKKEKVKRSSSAKS